MTKLLTISVLGLASWLAVSTAWAVTAHLTPLPGPTQTVSAAVNLSSQALEAVDVPEPLATPREMLAKRVRAGGRVLGRFYAVPERLAENLVHRLPPHVFKASVSCEL